MVTKARIDHVANVLIAEKSNEVIEHCVNVKMSTQSSWIRKLQTKMVVKARLQNKKKTNTSKLEESDNDNTDKSTSKSTSKSKRKTKSKDNTTTNTKRKPKKKGNKKNSKKYDTDNESENETDNENNIADSEQKLRFERDAKVLDYKFKKDLLKDVQQPTNEDCVLRRATDVLPLYELLDILPPGVSLCM